MTLRVELSIVPHGIEGDQYLIDTINISNISKLIHLDHAPDFGDSDECVYVVERNTYNTWNEHNTPRIVHRRSEGALKLVRKALKALKDEPVAL